MPETVQKPRAVRTTGLVQAVRAVTPHMQQITVGGPEIAEFLKMDGVDEPAAWAKVFLPSGEGRAYTVRRVDFIGGSMGLDFVLHGTAPDSGPASIWAAHLDGGRVLRHANAEAPPPRGKRPAKASRQRERLLEIRESGSP